jgi:hypothetical protein
MDNYRHFHTEVEGTWAPGEKFRKVRPVETKEYLRNPHKGIVTFQHFNGDPMFVKDWCESGPTAFNYKKRNPEFNPEYVPTTVAYCRWFWATVEPEEGVYDFSVIEKALKVCRVTNQTLMARIMPFGENLPGQTILPGWYLKKYPTKAMPKGWYEPDYEGDDYLRCWGRLHRELGRRFNDEPLLDTYDAGYLGFWGEGNGVMSVKQINKFVQMYLACFDRKKLLAEFFGIQLREMIRHRTGWRANTWGDMNNYGHGVVPNGLGWNHTYDAYPSWVIQAGARDAWKYAPVHMESKVSGWYVNDMPLEFVDFAIEQALKLHLTGINAGYILIPYAYKQKFMDLTERMGYRFVLRYLVFEHIMKNNRFKYNVWIDNTGVAPIYRDLYAFAFRFTQGKKKVVVLSKQDITTWMPEYTWFEETLTVPDRFRSGDIQVETAIVDRKTLVPKVKFGIKGMNPDGWYPMETLHKQ